MSFVVLYRKQQRIFETLERIGRVLYGTFTGKHTDGNTTGLPVGTAELGKEYQSTFDVHEPLSLCRLNTLEVTTQMALVCVKD